MRYCPLKRGIGKSARIEVASTYGLIRMSQQSLAGYPEEGASSPNHAALFPLSPQASLGGLQTKMMEVRITGGQQIGVNVKTLGWRISRVLKIDSQADLFTVIYDPFSDWFVVRPSDLDVRPITRQAADCRDTSDRADKNDPNLSQQIHFCKTGQGIILCIVGTRLTWFALFLVVIKEGKVLVGVFVLAVSVALIAWGENILLTSFLA